MQKQNLSLINKFRVTSADTDVKGRLKISALENYLIQSAINSASKLGFGFSDLQKSNLFWVLSRIDIRINRPVFWNEEITVETWPKNLEKILYLRDFIVKDSENKIIAKSTSGWLAVDTQTKRPKKIEAIKPEIFYILKEKHAMKDTPHKILPINNGDSFEVKTLFSDLDLNGHVTSVKYSDKMFDTFETDFLIKNFPKKISINYIKETKPAENIKITRKQTVEKTFIFEGKNLNTGTIAFRGKIEF